MHIKSKNGRRNDQRRKSTYFILGYLNKFRKKNRFARSKSPILKDNIQTEAEVEDEAKVDSKINQTFAYNDLIK